MSKIQKHYDLMALTQMPVLTMSVLDINELRLQLALRLQRELLAAKDEAIRDLLDFSTEQLRECSPAAKAVVRAHDEDGADTEAAEEAYFREHREVLELYLPGHLLLGE